jgi:hypothetical protein
MQYGLGVFGTGIPNRDALTYTAFENKPGLDSLRACFSDPKTSRVEKEKEPKNYFGPQLKSGGNLLSRKLYSHYHRQDCV